MKQNLLKHETQINLVVAQCQMSMSMSMSNKENKSEESWLGGAGWVVVGVSWVVVVGW